ncbi:uncharacterized protein LOC119083331 [Bradysia coprophila]|uniref:uncharacterized protein LOC119083331 n=1 Tax=Bradysia coprophila TaxID=38358 RepID=UPI00187DC2A9|nr:uncharacterized protein LOC119083331 [Bradysia coprophila]XP_037048914.1 uncharacterized protein LOC119083331 [Bradysia coprophila]XP_037048915.1 uncharacterized protein LOC119083331 [Bradysia coprophila]
MDDNKHRIQCQNKKLSIPLRLSNLNVNCLNELFQYLNISDLILLSMANLTNHKNLDRAFTAETKVTTHPYEACIRDRFLQLDYSNNNVTNNPDCILFEKIVFHYFGTLISKVRLYYDINYQRCNANIEQVVMEYGSALSEIGLINADISAFENISEPFQNVTKLKFDNGWLGPTFIELSKWFPNLKCLSLNETQLSDVRFIRQENPNLIELSLKNKCLCECSRMNPNVLADNVLHYTIGNLNLKQILALVPNLKRLSLCHDKENTIFEQDRKPYHFLIQIDFDLLLFITNSLMQLCYLKLNIIELSLFRIPTCQVAFNELKTLVIETSNTNQLTQLNITADELNHLEIIVHSFIQDVKLLANFVVRFERIEYLSIGHHPVDLKDDDFIHMINSLMKLKALQIALYKNKFTDDLVYIIEKFNRLHTVLVSCIEVAPTDRELFLEFVNENNMLKRKNWSGSCIFGGFEFKKNA